MNLYQQIKEDNYLKMKAPVSLLIKYEQISYLQKPQAKIPVELEKRKRYLAYSRVNTTLKWHQKIYVKNKCQNKMWIVI